MTMAAPKMYTKSTVKSTGCTVASDSCAGSRRTCTRLRCVSAATCRHHDASGSRVVGAWGWTVAATSDLHQLVGIADRFLGGVAGEDEEHVVERGVVHLDVVDREAG